MKLLAVYTTVASAQEAQAMARALVERQLAACAQINQIESVYTWQGAVQQSAECRILFKTTANLYPAVEAAIRELHSYDLPAIYAVAFEQAYEPFAAWVQSCASGGTS
ncbi:MAG: divalent-cation tolerance protein CutA [Burkholderiales bacterium]|nr:divalent-cation tolerance protein CutA [Burkholderiales bacterium]